MDRERDARSQQRERADGGSDQRRKDGKMKQLRYSCGAAATVAASAENEAPMRGFIIAWLAAFGIVTVIAAGVTWYVARNTPPLPPTMPLSAGAALATPAPAPPFVQADAVDLIVRRLPVDTSGEQLRQKLQSSANVTYHSPQHWRVCVDNACWVAHGPGRYAEPENEAARQNEGATVSPR
jgi:hypothetical protein